jgi:hypothetical protein
MYDGLNFNYCWKHVSIVPLKPFVYIMFIIGWKTFINRD